MCADNVTELASHEDEGRRLRSELKRAERKLEKARSYFSELEIRVCDLERDAFRTEGLALAAKHYHAKSYKLSKSLKKAGSQIEDLKESETRLSQEVTGLGQKVENLTKDNRSLKNFKKAMYCVLPLAGILIIWLANKAVW